MQSRFGRLSLFRVFLTVLLLASSAQAEPKLTLSASLNWRIDEPWFGGISGAEISADGGTLQLITDRGHFAEVALTRQNGDITGLTLLRQHPMRHRNGNKLRGKQSADAEGLALAPDGTAYVSFERNHRIARLDLETGQTYPLPKAAAFGTYEPNSGMEAFAIHPDGWLFTLPERSAGREVAFDLIAFANDTWHIAHRVPRRGPFLPVGADFDQSGMLYLLERAASPLGFRSRIRRFDLHADQLREETLLTTRANRFDNLETLTVWRDTMGQTRLTLISDNNFLRIQRTQIVEFILTE